MPKFSSTGVFSGGLSGAQLGGMIGGPMGSLIGGGLGALGGGLFGNSGAKKDRLKKINSMTPGAQKFYDEIIGQLRGSYKDAMNVEKGYLDPNSSQYDVIQAPSIRAFNEQTIPGLAERFSGFGANSGALSSSGFGQALGAAGAGLQERLAAMRAARQESASKNIFSQSQSSLQVDPYHYYNRAGNPGLSSYLGNFASQITPEQYGQIGTNLGQGFNDFQNSINKYLPIIGGI